MKKGIFSLMMGLLLAFTGIVRANDLTVHDGTTSSSTVPMYVGYFDDFTRTQSVYPASELAEMNGGTIESIKLYCTSSNIPYTTVSTVNVYLTEVDYTSISAFVSTASCTVVYTGTLSFVSAGNGGECTITFSTPYTYNGGNLLLGVENVNDLGYKFIYFYGETVNGASVGGYNGSSLSGVSPSQRNFLAKTTFTYSGGTPGTVCPLTVAPEPLDLGYRPNNCWMRPMVATVTNEGAACNINGLDFSGNYFTADLGEITFPFVLDRGASFDVNILWGTGNGQMDASMAIDYTGNRMAGLFDITAVAYEPVCPDVFEMARVVNSYPYTETLTASAIPLYDNYLLPPTSVQDGPDAVWKLTFTEDQLLNATVDGENGKIAVYTEDFYGFGGPDLANNYTGPMGGPAGSNPYDIVFGDGTSTSSYQPCYAFYNNSLTQQLYLAEDLLAAGMSAGVINTIGYNTGSSFNYNIGNVKIYMANVADATAPATSMPASSMTLVCESNNVYPVTGWNDFELNGNFEWDGTSNLLVMFQRNHTSYNSGLSWYYTEKNYTAGAYAYSDGTSYNPQASTYTLTTTNYLPNTHFVGNNREGAERDVTASITNMTMIPGTYYLVASATSDQFTVEINAETMPCPEEMTTEANLIAPLDDEDGLDPASVTLEWHLSEYTTEYRLVFGTTYYCEDVLVDWTTDLAESYTVTNLYNNSNYFWRVEERNAGCPDGIASPVWGFTTHLNVPTNLHSTNTNGTNLYEGETLHLAWTAIQDRTFRQYNIYQNGELIGSTPANPSPTATTTFDVTGLTYNMGGYVFNVTALYDEGESAFSNSLTVRVTGEGEVDGYVFEQDGTTGIAGATVTKTGIDEFGRPQTYTFTTGANGYYHGAMLAGEYNGVATCDGYQEVAYAHNPFTIVYDELTPDINYIMDENFTPVGEVIAEYYPDPDDPDSPYVKVYWGWNIMSAIIEDFETGDFSQFEYNFPGSYPWSIVTTHPYEGQYCMKSGGTNIASASSSVEVTVEIPRDGLFSFYSYISCESSWDNGYYYMDGVQMGTVTGLGATWGKKEFAVTEGTHTFKWTYTKDSSVNSGEDAWFVDYIDFIHDPEPAQPGWHTYAEGELDNALGSNLTTTPSWGYLYPNGGGFGGMTMTKVALFSDNMYGAVGGNYTLNIICGGATPDEGTVASTMTVDVPSNQGAWVEWTLTTPVAITGTQNVWVIWTANTTVSSWPAGMAPGSEVNGSWWNGGSGWEQMLSSYGDVWTMKNYFAGRDGRTIENSYSNHAVAQVPQYTTFQPVKGQEIEGVTVCNPSAVHSAVATANNRSFQFFRVYRTNCYNDGPYTPENTVVLACEVTDTLYIDVSWPDAAPGVYKWGVGCVYGGNRESEIAWSEPVVVPSQGQAAEATRDIIEIGDGTGTTYVTPFNSLWGYSVVEQIYTAAEIGTAGTINSISFNMDPNYTAQTNQIEVFMKNVSRSDFADSYEPLAATDLVYSGTVTFNGGWTTITLDTPFQYDGTSNLMVAMHEFTAGYSTRYFYYTTASNAVTSFHSDTANPDPYNLGSFSGTNYLSDYRANIKLDITPGGSGDPIQEPRESPIVWSNCLDKDMFIENVDVTVLLNSADSPEGVVVSLVNLNPAEQDMYPVVPVTLDESGFYAWDSFRRGEYAVNVDFGDAYEPIFDTVSIWGETHLRYVMTEILYGVGNIYVSRTGWAMWDGSTPGPGPTPGGDGDTFEFGFDTGLDGWTNIDADGDGEVWYHSTQCESMHSVLAITSHSGAGHLCSESYCNATWEALTPNNFLVSPQMYNIGGSSVLSFWCCAQDASYAAEHFGVAISTTGNTNAADFTTISEWTLTAKGGSEAPAGATRNGKSNREGNWYQFTCDLSAYAGQQVWIAIRHFNVSDQFLICLDDMALANSGAKSGDRHLEYYKVLCTSIDGVPIYNHNTVYPFCQLDTNDPYQAPLVEGDHYLCKVACMYSTGMSAWSEPVEWVYEPCDHWGPVDFVNEYSLSVGNHIEWEFEHGYNPYEQPVGPVTGPTEFVEGFEGGLNGWNVLNVSGEGSWIHSDDNLGGYDYTVLAHTGTGFAMGYSFVDYVGACNIDSYLYTPQKYDIVAGSTLTFWADNANDSYPESFSVCIATADNPTAADFTQVWSGSAKAGNAAKADVRHDANRYENWRQHTIDLSAYAGQSVYIAFHDVNYDMYEIWIDDVQLTAGAKGANAFESGMTGNAYALNITDVANFDERVFMLYNLNNDIRFDVILGEADGMFMVTAAAGYEDMDLEEAINDFMFQNNNQFRMMDKVQAADVAREYKAALPVDFANSLMMDIYAASRQNNLCATAEPFCTDNGMYEFPAGVNAGSGETGPYYDCLYSTPNPAWYYMKIDNPGDMDIYMYSTPSEDIDFCCWGPFDDPSTPCPDGLTADKVVSCSYSINPTEDCLIPATAQTGEYYILVITNYSNDPCNINFSKVSGSGTTDCGIMPEVDIIGFLITLDGEYLDIVGPTVRDYTHEGEFGDHVYCVRPIYPGEQTLPDHNYGWSMGCPICSEDPVPGICEPGDPIRGEYVWNNANDFGALISWGEQVEPIAEWLYYDDGVYATNVGAGGTLYWGTMFPANALTPYAGCSLTQVAVHSSYACSATLNVYYGGTNAPATLVHSQTVNFSGNGDFDEITLNSALPLDGENLWITFYQSGETYPADACTDTGDANNRWVSIDGASWMDLATAGLPGYGWMIRGYVTNMAKGGEVVALNPFKGNVGGELSHTAVVSIPADLSFMNRAEIVKYNVYRSADNVDYTFIGSVNAVAGQDYYEYYDATAAGMYYYQVKAEYSDGCESDGAPSEANPANNYVIVNVTGVVENGQVALYPNPTNGNITINAQNMNRITVVSVLGQVVYDAEVEGDEQIINMAQFNAGVYMVRIATGNGVSTQRVTVVK